MEVGAVHFNCNLDIIRLLADRCDLLLLQETQVTEYNSDCLSNLGNDFMFSYTPAVICGPIGHGRAAQWWSCYFLAKIKCESLSFF